MLIAIAKLSHVHKGPEARGAVKFKIKATGLICCPNCQNAGRAVDRDTSQDDIGRAIIFKPIIMFKRR